MELGYAMSDNIVYVNLDNCHRMALHNDLSIVSSEIAGYHPRIVPVRKHSLAFLG